MSDGEFDWGGRLRKGIGGAQRFPQNGRKPFEECKGRRELDCDTAALMQCLRQCAKAGGKSPAAAAAPAPVPAHLESAVADVLHEIGVPAHVKGYQYLREGILFTIRDADPTAGITKVLYPTVAKKFSSTPSCVERSMRHAIDIAWNRGDEDVQEKIFCGAFSGSTGRPTNGEFIATIAELVLQQIGK